MDYIRKIPLLLGLGAALLIGLIGYTSGIPNKDNMLNVLLGMVIFYLAGIFIRSTIKDIIEQTIMKIIKKKEEDKKHQLDLKKEEDQRERDIARDKAFGRSFDMVADGKAEPGAGDDDFDVLPVADFIKKELK